MFIREACTCVKNVTKGNFASQSQPSLVFSVLGSKMANFFLWFLKKKCWKTNVWKSILSSQVLVIDYFVTVDVCYVKEQDNSEMEIMGYKCAISDTFNFSLITSVTYDLNVDFINNLVFISAWMKKLSVFVNTFFLLCAIIFCSFLSTWMFAFLSGQ